MLMVGINTSQICPELNANEIQVLYDKYHKVPSFKEVTKTVTHNSVKYEAKYENIKWPCQI